MRNFIWLQYLKIKLKSKGYKLRHSYNYDICLSHNNLKEIPDFLLNVPFSIDFSYNNIQSLKNFIANNKVCFSLNKIENLKGFKYNTKRPIYFQNNKIKKIPLNTDLIQLSKNNYDTETIFFNNPLLKKIIVKNKNHDLEFYKENKLNYFSIEKNRLSSEIIS